MFDAIAVWLLLTVFFSLLPLLVDRIKGRTNSWKDFWSDGQVLLVVAALGAESLGDAMLNLRKVDSLPISMVAANFVIVVVAAMFYSDSCDEQRRNMFIYPAGSLSLTLLTLSLILSVLAKITLIQNQLP
ncbi:hypothetical protein C7293_01430 [filamentous cyanobacterium CCT1]|nr:hypothetical protein C7293_01430 [filamentous cyanobacterium CCT1]PSN79835.1 hypothetical protein C8B47_09595 [filamentous cyanobacterium CCP4]